MTALAAIAELAADAIYNKTKEVPQHAERAAICVNKDNMIFKNSPKSPVSFS